ncbi:MAG: response regulator RpfG family c-di-GMP phosphodiesterase, partial [Bradymonadia bacterium]
PSSGDAANIDKVAPQAFVSSLPTHEAETPIAFDIYDTLELDVRSVRANLTVAEEKQTVKIDMGKGLNVSASGSQTGESTSQDLEPSRNERSGVQSGAQSELTSPSTGGDDQSALTEELVFARESPQAAAQPPWSVLVVDDDKAVHAVTKMVLADFELDGRALNFVHAYSGAEACQVMTDRDDFAVVLLDVVMETDTAGLDTVHFIRNTLGNADVRIVLRTGQPGHAPEQTVIRDYDINDYREKTELSANKLHTTMYTALRSFRDIRALSQHREGLERVLHASTQVFRERSIDRFAESVLEQLQGILSLGGSEASAGIAAISNGSEAPTVRAATGRYIDFVGGAVTDIPRKTAIQSILAPPAGPRGKRGSDHFVGNYATRTGTHHVVFVEGDLAGDESIGELLELFGRNVSTAYENLLLRDEMEATLREIIYRLSEVVENRSKETGNHVRRVAEYSRVLGEELGLPEQDLALLYTATPLHDIGKVGIADEILKKPGKLTNEEFAHVKKHAQIGATMLGGSEQEVFRAASVIAGQHHERWDGKGYPHGLSGEQIHVFGRIVAVADVFDALCSRRCYKDAWPLDRALALFAEERGAQFEPRVVDALMARLDTILEIQERFADSEEEFERLEKRAS